MLQSRRPFRYIFRGNECQREGGAIPGFAIKTLNPNQAAAKPNTANVIPPALSKAVAQICQACTFDARHVTLLDGPAIPEKDRFRGHVHIHESWELVLALKGPMLGQLPNMPVRRFPKYHLVLVPPASAHVRFQHLMAARASRSDWFALVMTFDEIFMTARMAGVRAPRGGQSPVFYSLSAQDKDKWRELLRCKPLAVINAAADALRQEGPWRDAYLDACLKLFFAALLAVLATAVPRATSKADSIVSRAMSFINTHYSDPKLSLADIAAAAGISISKLAAVFKKTMGISAWQALLQLRLKHAQALLQSKNYSVKETAFMTGWSNQLYFSHAYHKRYGCAPSRIRAGKK